MFFAVLNFFHFHQKAPWRFLMLAIALFNAGGASFAQSSSVRANESGRTALLEKYTSLTQQLAQNTYRRPIVFESEETRNALSSSVYAVLDSPFSAVSTTFQKPELWCEVLILHLNTKHCKATSDAAGSGKVSVNIGKKVPQKLSDTFLLEFSHRLKTNDASFLAVDLLADNGPLNTTDYRLQLFATPLADGKTFINLRYSYSFGLTGRMAMQAYLSTVGRGKVGFTKITTDEKTDYTKGMLGAVERNTMRYYLAMEAYLVSLKHKPADQPAIRMRHWFDATEEYSLQLHELDRSSYLAMKIDEYQRQQLSAKLVR